MRGFRRVFTPRRLGLALLLLVVAELLLLRHSKPEPVIDVQDPIPTPINVAPKIPTTLTTAQCEDIFPNLYVEIDRAVAYWRKRRHLIGSRDLNLTYRDSLGYPKAGGAVRILIHDNELRIVESHETLQHLGWRSRAIGILSLVDAAVKAAAASGELLPTIEASLVVEDIVEYPTRDGTHSYWTFAANNSDPEHNRHWLVPNFDFYSAGGMGSYREAQRRAVAHDSSWKSKIPKVVWRGTMWFNDVRVKLNDVAANRTWADVMHTDPKKRETYMPIDEMCRYAFTVHTEGGSYSGRLKYLLNCDSVPIVHKLSWRTFYTHLLIKSGPSQNYVETERNFSDLEKKVKYYLKHPERAELIAQNAVSHFRHKYLAPAAQLCYLRKLIIGYSSVSEEPDIYRPKRPWHHIEIRRGRSWEDYLAGQVDFSEEKTNDDWM